MVKQIDTEKNKDKSLKKWLKMFDDSWTYAQQNCHQRWERNWKLYHNIRTKKSHPGNVTTFIPMVNSSVNTIVSALFNSNPSVNYIPNHPDQEAETDVLNEIYDDFARKDGWVEKNKNNGRQGLITGNMCSYYEWVNDKDGGYVHKIVVPIRDMIIDPQSSSYENWRYVGRRFFSSKKELEKATVYDFELGKDVKKYKNLDKIIGGSGNTDFESDKQKKDQMLGSVAPDDEDMVELIEIWTKKKVVVIANRNTIIEEKENPHYLVMKAQYEQRKAQAELEMQEWLNRKADWDMNRNLAFVENGVDIIGEFTEEMPKEFDEEFNEEDCGLLPFAMGRDYSDISLPYGTGDVDIIAEQQELLNDFTELNLEAILYTLYPERTLDPKYSAYADDLEPMPGKVYPLPAGVMVWNNPPTIPMNAFNERAVMKDEIREAIAISEISKGVDASNGTTATEIKAQLGQADLRIQEKAQSLAHDYFFQEAKIVLKLIQLYAPDEMWVRTIADAKVNFRMVNPKAFMGEYMPMVTLETQKKLEKAQQQEASIQAFQIMISDPTNNLQAIKEIMYKKIMPELSDEEIKMIISKPEQPQMMMGGGQGMIGGGQEMMNNGQEGMVM